MLIWDTAQYLCKTFSGDSSAASLVAFKTLMNLGYKEILHTFDGEETEDVRTTTTQTSTRAIKLAPNFIRIHTVTATVGNQVYDLVPEESQSEWNNRLFNNRTSSRPTTYFIRPRLGTGGSEILLDPIPSNNTTVITINYAANARDLEIDKYTTGTISLTGGVSASTTVTGSGTTFTEAMVGRYLKVDDVLGDGNWYRITGFSSPTSVVMENKYDGSTVAGRNFILAEAFNLPEDLQMAPVEYAMWYYYLGVRKDARQAREWGLKYTATKTLAEKNYQKKNKNATINNRKPGSSVFPVATPNFWPDHATGS